MRSKGYKKPEDLFTPPTSDTKLPIEQPVAAYYRQSTLAQIGNVSTAMQTIDMPAYLQRCGWKEKNIVLIDMDAGVSGSTKIDEREGMRQLFDLISEKQVGAVACQDEDRLFRDVTQIQVNIFIEACRQANVLVITPSMIYDFANEMTGTFHARQFRFKSEMAAEYISSYIKGKLHRAKRRLQMEGRWAGWGTPAGFMIDMRKTLPDGTKNENWRRYVPFEPYAKVIREYFRIFLSYSGQIRATFRHIHKHGPFYPDPATCLPPKGFKVHYKIHRYKNGFCPGRTALTTILTNAAYIGHWAVNEVIVHWNNHPAIVPEDVFMQAFNYLAPYSLDGTKNTDYRPNFDYARPSLDERRGVERPLCAGMIVAQEFGKWRNVGVNWVTGGKHGPGKYYSYVFWSSMPDTKYIWSKRADFFDAAVTRLLKQKLRATFDTNMWEKALQTFTKNYQKERKRLQLQVTRLETVLENLISSLETIKNPSMIRKTESRYEAAQEEHERSMSQVRSMENDAQQMEVLKGLKSSCEPVLNNWHNMTKEEKQTVLRAFVDKIEATPGEAHSLLLQVWWKDQTSNTITLPRQATTGKNWLPEEAELLLKLVDNGATQVEIAQTFPDRKWKYIRNKYSRLRQHGLRLSPKPIREAERFTDYVARVGKSEVLAHMGFDAHPEKARPYAKG